MNLQPGQLSLMPMTLTEPVFVFATSKPQYHVLLPWIIKLPSIVARSPGYWRTTTGELVVPLSVAVTFVAGYRPPRSQTVSPGCTCVDVSPVTRSQGREAVPSPLADPLGDT